MLARYKSMMIAGIDVFPNAAQASKPALTTHQFILKSPPADSAFAPELASESTVSMLATMDWNVTGFRGRGLATNT